MDVYIYIYPNSVADTCKYDSCPFYIVRRIPELKGRNRVRVYVITVITVGGGERERAIFGTSSVGGENRLLRLVGNAAQ